MAQDTEEAIRKKEEEAEERRQQSHNMVADTIKRELLESTSNRLFYLCLLLNAPTLPAEEREAEIPDIDDADGLDLEAEFEAWRLRELARIKRDKEAEVQRELEREEIERRRALPEEQRLKEDMENAKRTRDEKPKGQQKFLQKYWHKGAFHQVSCSPFHCGGSVLTRVQSFVGRGGIEETRFHGSHGIYYGCFDASSSHASQKLWKARSDQVHSSCGPRYNRRYWRVRRGQDITKSWRHALKSECWLFYLRWPAYEKG